MDNRGRPRKTAEQRRREGGTKGKGAVSHRPIPETLILSPRLTEQEKPEPPDLLPPAAQELWREAIQQLIDMNAAQTVDLPALFLMAIQWEMAVRNWLVLCQEGWFAHGSTGQIVRHPAYDMFNEACAKFLTFARDFGLTTLARTRLGTLELERTSMAHDLLQRGLGKNPLRASAELNA